MSCSLAKLFSHHPGYTPNEWNQSIHSMHNLLPRPLFAPHVNSQQIGQYTPYLHVCSIPDIICSHVCLIISHLIIYSRSPGLLHRWLDEQCNSGPASSPRTLSDVGSISESGSSWRWKTDPVRRRKQTTRSIRHHPTAGQRNRISDDLWTRDLHLSMRLIRSGSRTVEWYFGKIYFWKWRVWMPGNIVMKDQSSRHSLLINLRLYL